MATKTESTRTPDVATTILREMNDPLGRAVGVRFDYADGSDPVILVDTDVTETIRAELEWHGGRQKIGDAGAISRNPATGKSATIADKRAAMVEVRDRLAAGLWNKVREGDGSGNASILLAAMIRLYSDRTADVLKTWLDSLTDDERAALTVTESVAPTVAAIRAERAAKRVDPKIDAAAILASLPPRG